MFDAWWICEWSLRVCSHCLDDQSLVPPLFSLAKLFTQLVCWQLVDSWPQVMLSCVHNGGLTATSWSFRFFLPNWCFSKVGYPEISHYEWFMVINPSLLGQTMRFPMVWEPPHMFSSSISGDGLISQDFWVPSSCDCHQVYLFISSVRDLCDQLYHMISSQGRMGSPCEGAPHSMDQGATGSLDLVVSAGASGKMRATTWTLLPTTSCRS